LSKILIIQLRQLGDVLLSAPLAQAVKEGLGAEVHFLTSPLGREIVEGNPYIDKIVTLENGVLAEIKTLLEVRREGYSAVIDAQRTGRSKRITLFSGAPLRIAFKKEGDNLYYNCPVEWKNRGYTVWERMELLKPLGIENPPKLLPRFYLREEEVEKGRELIKDLGLEEGGFFTVVPTARYKEKSWGFKKFGELSRLVFEHFGLTPLFAYAPGEEEMAREAFEACGEGVLLPKPLPIRKFASVVNLSRFLIGNDSFAPHLSLSLEKKTFVILGAFEGWFPDVNWVVKVKKGLDCQPCGNLRGCDRNLACYRELSVGEVFEELKAELNVN